MTLIRAAVLRPGDLVRYDGGDHQVIALAGTSESVVLLAYLMASPGFAVIDGALATMGGTVRAVGRPVGEGARGGARVGAPYRGGGDGVTAQPAARCNAPSRLRPGEHDDRREGPSQGGRVGRDPAYGADAAGDGLLPRFS